MVQKYSGKENNRKTLNLNPFSFENYSAENEYQISEES